MNRLFSLIAGDVRNIARDAMLLLILSAPILILAVLRFGIPPATELLNTQFGFDLSPYYPLIFIFFCGLVPMMFGMLIGLVFLDEQDEDIIQFIAVTPLQRGGYLRQKFGLPSLAAFLYLLLFYPLSGLSDGDPIRFIPLAALLGTEVPLCGMFLAGFASNKVEGLALAKAMGIYIVAPIVGYFVHSPLQYVAGISPIFWISEAYLTTSVLIYWINLIIGILVHFGVFYLLYRKFTRKILRF